MTWLRWVGKLALSVGCGVLMFVAWMVWGTSLQTHHDQQRLDQQLNQLPPFSVQARSDEAGPPDRFAPGPGAPAFRIKIPTIDLNEGRGFVVVEGVGPEQLATGPGHYPSCRSGFAPPLCTAFDEVWPGERGRVIVSAHRTTHGAPFLHTDQLEKGDTILIETRWGNFSYEVFAQRSVDDTDRSVVVPVDGERQLVLTSCDPPGSASSRLITYARLKSR